ncbi:vacuolar fusion protein MON1 homolog A-like [Pantherophis guttatus]|uniref:Vacuolar fusion protein MON1 homolog n=1 Tax=Pantherophis guttatus TaxID=94885 RepID=A0ABM3Z7T1_PANGU|nr:vacuolar fusion protein MON1 homolog A [Pantherophis guttatus]XP_060544418.1 vacuolar fusion protein MON1 homolog A [Pantherophis guttatus]XP_060544419.1 vacuolar fusion protein MON1 homolog A [Pantherophis guttatus]XP_060544420.1 vacuolar fusion protein MON1 homolog A [Pantherophis guttatus]XP_060544422.1 vacuolar fusion protein MON1 homolog A [Pantherophis guttatus]XP_060547343.1 vacuolar fusion protein MON1 homolog A-like [Pantherophis guttatus]XP_060547344.1 vacuolar fusion protein MON
MAADVYNKKDVPNGSLAPTGGQQSERSESPTPGLTQGTEPGAGQEGAIFVHTRSYEDLTGTDNTESAAKSPGEREESQRDELKIEEISKDFSELSTQLTGIALDLEEEIRQNSEGNLELSPQGSRRDSVLSGKEEEDITMEAWRMHQKHVFVLSEAGKPIYSRYGCEEALSTTMGVMMALVSFVEAEKNAIRSIHADGYKVVFVRKSPLVLVAVAQTRQSEQEIAQELLYIYYQIVSLLTLTQLNRIFQQKQNYDLRRLLAGSERITDNLVDLMARDPSFLMGAARCLPMAAGVRDVVSTCLQQAKAKSLVFAILLSKNQLVSLVRKRDQFLHPIDLHLLFNLISSSSSFREGEGWTPICLPKFNSNGFFHAHISYLEPNIDLCLVLISTDREDFFTVSHCKQKFQERLKKRGVHHALLEAVRTPFYSVSQVGIPDLRHFIYKSKSSGLFTSPEIEAPYITEEEKERLLELYQYLHSRAHNSTRPLNNIYYIGSNENLLAWVTSAFELYVCFTPLGTKAAAVSAVNKLMKWIRKEEDRLFILSPQTY